MQRSELSAPAWKWLVSALALGVAVLLAAEVGAGTLDPAGPDTPF